MTAFAATTPDGHTYTRTSKTTYVAARWIKFPDDPHQVIISWHRTADAAARSPFQSPNWKSLPHGIVEVAVA